MIEDDYPMLRDDPPEIEALWKEIEARELDDELYLQACEYDNEPLSQEEIDAYDVYLSSPEGIAARNSAEEDFKE